MAIAATFMASTRLHSTILRVETAQPLCVPCRHRAHIVVGTIVNMSSMMSQTNKTIQMAYNSSEAMEDAVSASCRTYTCVLPYFALS